MTKPVILGAMTVAVADSALANMQRTKSPYPTAKIVVGGWVVAIGLLAISDRHPSFARTTALLIMFATLAGPNNTALLSTLSHATGGVGFTVAKGSGLGGISSGVTTSTSTTPTKPTNKPPIDNSYIPTIPMF